MTPALALSLIPLFQAIFAQGGIEAALGTLSFAQWGTIAVQAVTAGPAALDFLKKLHPALAQLASDIEKDGAMIAAATLHTTLVANTNESITLQPGAGSES